MVTTSEKSAAASTQSAPRSKCDIVYLAKGRPEFTAASLEALGSNTNWALVDKLHIYTDGGSVPQISAIPASVHDTFNWADHGGPVAIMNAYLEKKPAPLWAKIDNDVIVPPGWLDACLDVMDAHPELDLLGIEPPESRTPAPWMRSRVPAPENNPALKKHAFSGINPACPGMCYAACDSIGGIGMFRTRAWQGRAPMRPHSTYGGFTDWQENYTARVGGTRARLHIGWIVPPLKLFLLDRMPMEPWTSLSKRYISENQQREWTNYSAAEAESLAGWWLK